jgi:phosphoribosylanthranilate isomerase
MTWIKICGITNLEDAQMAVAAGADALGFVFYEKSPRKVEPDTVEQIVATLPGTVDKVGVFVDQPVERIREIVGRTGLTALQLYKMERVVGMFGKAQGAEERLQPKIIFVMSGISLTYDEVFIGSDLRKAVHAVLIDSALPEQPGGTGRQFDWEKMRKTFESLGRVCPTIVAGGLTPDNVVNAIRTLKPWGVDVASGVEAHPGEKDPGKVRAFVAAVRKLEKNV